MQTFGNRTHRTSEARMDEIKLHIVPFTLVGLR